jgi:hypothetical protein
VKATPNPYWVSVRFLGLMTGLKMQIPCSEI